MAHKLTQKSEISTGNSPLLELHSVVEKSHRSLRIMTGGQNSDCGMTNVKMDDALVF